MRVPNCMRNWEKDALTVIQSEGRYSVTLDDDAIIPRIIQKVLSLETRAFASISEFKKNFKKLNPTAVFVDIHLANGECGLDIIPDIKARWPEAPVIVLTADSNEFLVSQALANGADDFILKPIRPTELVARLATRKNEIDLRNSHTLLRFGDLVLDRRNKMLSGSKGQRFQSPREAEILAYMIQENGAVIQKANLRQRIWGDIVVNDNAIDRKLYEVRATLKDVSDRVEILSIYGQGVALRQRSFPHEPQNSESH